MVKTIAQGAVAPDFEVPDQYGKLRSLSSLTAGGPVVLFFYPTAMSGGCTTEACSFRDLAAEFAVVGATRVGISPDIVAKQQLFAQASKLDFPLLSDVDGAVAASLGVKRKRLAPVKRVTLVIDTDRKVLAVISNEFSMTAHAARSLEFLRRRRVGGAPG